MPVGKYVGRTILEEVAVPLFLEGTLGVDVGSGSDGVLVGKMTKQAPLAAYQYDHDAETPVYTDATAGAANATANDMPFFPEAPAVNDAFMWAFSTKFSELLTTIGTKMVLFVGTTVWEYSKAGGTWGTLTPTLDESTGLICDATGAKRTCFVPPSDWESRAITVAEATVVTGYWVRCRIATFTSATTLPLGTRTYITDLGGPVTATGLGIKVPVRGTLKRVQWYASTLSASNGDSTLLIMNVTRGTFATVAITKALAIGEVTGLGLGFAKNDQLVIKQIGEDGTTEFADVGVWLHFDQ